MPDRDIDVRRRHLPPQHPDWTPTGYLRCDFCRGLVADRPDALSEGVCSACLRDVQWEAESAARRAANRWL